MDGGTIQKLKENIASLVSRYEMLQAGNAEMSEKIVRYESRIAEQDKLIKELNEKLDNLQLTLAFGGTLPEKTEAKRKIQHLMKEIDKCISMLND
ncbi:MAG: hypothetical protein MJY60_05685 [Bacteroidales bacterium]|nr:hypothetical protein [Bacteroidales bacterium]